jgi:adenylosuccinate lyase
MKGAVGTSASFEKLLGKDGKARLLEEKVMDALGLDYFAVSTQTYPRKVDYILLSCLASIAASCHKFGLDLRVLQSPAFGELSEPMEELQVGSSAMPFKKNPVAAERMCSLARLVSAFPPVAFANAANNILERTLDDSASRRVAIPEAFLALDECLMIYERLMRGVRTYPAMIEKNLEKFGPFAGTEAVMMKLVEKGGDRQEIHELIRVESFAAWEEVMKGLPNPLAMMLSENKKIAAKLKPAEIKQLLDPRHHTGDAKERCGILVREAINPILSKHRKRVGIRGKVEY